MDWFERKIVRYVLLWAPSGPLYEEDVFPEFGMHVDQLHIRFSRIVAQQGERLVELAPGDRDLIERARRQTLTHPPQESRHGAPVTHEGSGPLPDAPRRVEESAGLHDERPGRRRGGWASGEDMS